MGARLVIYRSHFNQNDPALYLSQFETFSRDKQIIQADQNIIYRNSKSCQEQLLGCMEKSGY